MDDAVDGLRLRFGFAATVIVVFVGLLAFAAAAPDAMARPVVGAIPLSLVLASALIVFCVAITGTYVLLVNARVGRGS